MFPSLGPLFAERVGTGTGLLMPEAMHTEGQPDAGSYGAATFVGVDLHPEADTPATRERIGDGLAGLDLLGSPGHPLLGAGATPRDHRCAPRGPCPSWWPPCSLPWRRSG